MRLEYSDLRLVATGEPLSKESFDRLRASSAKVSVLVRGNPDERVDAVTSATR